MTKSTRTETRSTHTLQTPTGPTTKSGEYDVSPSPVIWWIIGIALLVCLVILIIAIVCIVKRQRARRYQERHLGDKRLKAAFQFDDVSRDYSTITIPRCGYSRMSRKLPGAHHTLYSSARQRDQTYFRLLVRMLALLILVYFCSRLSSIFYFLIQFKLEQQFVIYCPTYATIIHANVLQI